MRVVPDHRIPRIVVYPLDEMLLATLIGVVCGADDCEGVEEIAEGALEWLRWFLPFAGIGRKARQVTPFCCDLTRGLVIGESPCRPNRCCAPACCVRRILPHRAFPRDRQGIAMGPRRGSIRAAAPA